MVSSSVCDCCIHKDVCVYLEKYTDVVKLVGEAVERIGDDVEALKDFQMSVTVSCPHYMTKPNLRY